MCNHTIRPADLKWDRAECGDQFTMVVTVDFPNLPPECSPALSKRLHANRVLREVSLLNAVPINNEREIVELVLTRRHRGLPVAALLEFAIASQDESSPVRIVHLGCQRTPYGYGETVPERSSICFHS